MFKKGCELLNINIEKIKERIDKAAVFTVKKTGELAFLTKLKLKKTEAKGKLSDAYKELGEMVYINSKEENDISERLQFLLSRIDELHSEIDKYSKEEDGLKD